MPGASVILPTFNERETAPPIIESLLGQATVKEVVVVDDSTDGTHEVIRDAFENERVRVIHRDDGDGLSTAVLRGFKEADGEFYVCMDADGQHPPEAVPQLVDEVWRGHDLAIGSRHVGGTIEADWELDRYAMSFGASVLSWLAVPESRRVDDPMSGMFCARDTVVNVVRERLDPRGHKILLELLAVAPIDSVVEVPIAFDERDAGESTTDLQEMLTYLRHMGRLAVVSRRRYRPIRGVPEVNET